MDNHSAGLMQEEALEIHDGEICSTHSSMNFIQAKSEQVSAGEENGDITMEACAVDGGSSELASIDIMLPTLGSSVQNEHQQENDEPDSAYENAKQIQYEFMDQGENQEDATEHSNECEDAAEHSNECEGTELEASHNEMVELDNIRVIDVVVEEDQSQILQVHQDQVIVQTVETLNFDTTNTTTNESVENEEENFNSHMEEVDKENDEEAAAAAAAIKDYELEGGENGDLNPEEYSDDRVAGDANQFDDDLHHDTVPNYISQDYIAKQEEEEESLHESNNDDTPIERNHGYDHSTTTTSEMHLSNEELEEEEVTDGQHPLESNLMSASEEAYEEYANIKDSEETTEINKEEKTTAKPVTAAYRQENIINIAAASANIDIQDGTSRSSEMVDQEENQFDHNEMESCSIEESVSIILNSGGGGVDDTAVENSAGGEMIMIQKGEGEGTSEVIEEIYFIQDVSTCSSNNFEQNKDKSNVEEDEEEVDDRVETVHSQGIHQQNQDDLRIKSRSSIAQNSGISEKSRNVIQDIFDDWGDENVDEDNQSFSHKDQDTVEIQLNNLLNENKKKIPGSSKETQQGTSKRSVDDFAAAPGDCKSAKVETRMENVSPSHQISTTVEKVTPSSSSSSTSSKKVTRNSCTGKDIPSYVQPYVRGTYSSSSSFTTSDQDQDQSNTKRKMQSPRLGVKVPSLHLKSQIASPAEVKQVLKERLWEKQKDLQSPQAADIVFVKKLTQRFASKICAGGTLPVPGLIPLSQPSRDGGNDNLERTESSNSTTTTTRLNENTDNRELLAILEGDVDPDWSNLKSQSTVATSATEDSPGADEDGSNYSISALSKLNPTIERELALKQLLELPSTGIKRPKKKTFNPAPNKFENIEKTSSPTSNSKKEEEKVDEEEEVGNNDDEEEEEIAKEEKKDVKKTIKTVEKKKDSSLLLSTRKPLKENDSQNTPSMMVSPPEIRQIDETRSGRKRKPTEKALEQYATKRQKIFKAKSSNKKGGDGGSPESNVDKGSNKMRGSSLVKKKSLLENSKDATMMQISSSPTKEASTKKQASTPDKNILPPSSSPSKRDKSLTEKKPASLVKEKTTLSPSPPFGNRKKTTASAAKKLISQRVLKLKKKSTLSSSTKLQSKLSTPVEMVKKRPVGRPAKVNVSKKPSAIPLMGGGSKKLEKTKVAKPKGRRGGIKEIDRLLQDEGVVNLLYDVGQPRKRRLIPITKSQKKVMDVEKAERDLNLRKKLVKNAVLGLHGSVRVDTDKMVHRLKRRTSLLAVNTEAQPSSITSPNEFIYPAKIRNAADASVIVRRHSSSSFSSVSGSPRVSIDAPLEGGSGGGSNKIDDETSHGLRSAAKRKHSSGLQDKDLRNLLSDAKRSKQQKVPQTFENTLSSSSSNKVVVTNDSKDKIASTKKHIKEAVVAERSNNKKMEKSSTSPLDTSEGSGSGESEKVCKVITRSNGGAGLKKALPKNQKKKAAIKDKSFSDVSSDSASSTAVLTTAEETTKSQDELSACLAEVATALSSVSGGGERGLSRQTTNGVTTAVGRKNKGSTSLIKTPLDAANSSSSHINKEINVCRNGNLVQLILTPSSSKIINGITLKVMQELRDVLTILKTDKECRVVLVTSTGGTSFCEGLDLSTLLHTDTEKRKIYAEEMANAVKEFIKCLATFNKPLVAGVQGAAVGLGVTILPLFDLVIASDKATFYTPYGKLGQIPEGAAIMTLSHVHGSAVASELLLGGRTLTASEALRAGLVTRVLWPDRFPLELLPSVKAMSEQSSQSMEATKALLRQSLRTKLNAALESETHILVQHWCSTECQEAIKAYIERKVE